MKNPPWPRRHWAGRRRQATVSAAALAALAVPVSLTAPAVLAAPASPAAVGGTRTAVQVWTTTTSSADTLAFQLAREPDVTFGPRTSQTPQITVDPSTTFQTIEGFGGAMTDTG